MCSLYKQNKGFPEIFHEHQNRKENKSNYKISVLWSLIQKTELLYSTLNKNEYFLL